MQYNEVFEPLRDASDAILFFDPGNISPGAGVDLDLVAFLDKGRDLQDIARLHRHRLAVGTGGIALGPGISLGHHQVDKHGQADIDGPVLKEEDLHIHIIGHVIDIVAQMILVNDDLLVIIGIHEVILVLLTVEILHLPLFQLRLFKLVIGAIGLDQLVAGDHVSHLAAIEGLTLSRLGELKVGNNKWRSINLNLQPLA